MLHHLKLVPLSGQMFQTNKILTHQGMNNLLFLLEFRFFFFFKLFRVENITFFIKQ